MRGGGWNNTQTGGPEQFLSCHYPGVWNSETRVQNNRWPGPSRSDAYSRLTIVSSGQLFGARVHASVQPTVGVYGRRTAGELRHVYGGPGLFQQRDQALDAHVRTASTSLFVDSCSSWRFPTCHGNPERNTSDVTGSRERATIRSGRRSVERKRKRPTARQWWRITNGLI